MAVNERPSPERLREVYESAIDKGRNLYQALNTSIWTTCARAEPRNCYEYETGPLRKTPKDLEEQLNASGINCTHFTFVDVREKGSSESSDTF